MCRFIKTIIKIKLMIVGVIAILWFAKKMHHHNSHCKK